MSLKAAFNTLSLPTVDFAPEWLPERFVGSYAEDHKNVLDVMEVDPVEALENAGDNEVPLVKDNKEKKIQENKSEVEANDDSMEGNKKRLIESETEGEPKATKPTPTQKYDTSSPTPPQGQVVVPSSPPVAPVQEERDLLGLSSGGWASSPIASSSPSEPSPKKKTSVKDKFVDLGNSLQTGLTKIINRTNSLFHSQSPESQVQSSSSETQSSVGPTPVILAEPVVVPPPASVPVVAPPVVPLPTHEEKVVEAVENVSGNFVFESPPYIPSAAPGLLSSPPIFETLPTTIPSTNIVSQTHANLTTPPSSQSQEKLVPFQHMEQIASHIFLQGTDEERPRMERRIHLLMDRGFDIGRQKTPLLFVEAKGEDTFEQTVDTKAVHELSLRQKTVPIIVYMRSTTQKKPPEAVKIGHVNYTVIDTPFRIRGNAVSAFEDTQAAIGSITFQQDLDN